MNKKIIKIIIPMMSVLIILSAFTVYAAGNNELAIKYGIKDYSIA